MKKTLVLALFALAGCPSSTTSGRQTTNGYKYRCPDPSTDCTMNNGRSVTGVVGHDAPASVTAIQLRSGENVVVR